MTFVVVDTLVEVELDIVDELAVVEDVDFTAVEVVGDEVSFVVDFVDVVVNVVTETRNQNCYLYEWGIGPSGSGR